MDREKELLLRNDKEALAEMIVEERKRHQDLLKKHEDLNRHVIGQLYILIGILK